MAETTDEKDGDRSRPPLDRLRTLAIEKAAISGDFRHWEIYTLDGLLTFLWHGDEKAESVVVACGGAMGGVLGPGDALYAELGATLPAEGIAVVRVGYRKPNDLRECVLDIGAACDLGVRNGAKRFVLLGHSFGGAVVVNAARAMRRHVVGVITFATQAGGCEGVELGDLPLLLFHGDRDEILPPSHSEVVATLSEGSEVVPLAGAGHLLKEAAPVLRDRVPAWIRERL